MLNYASPGTGTVGHLASELLKFRSGLAMAHVPHTGAAPALQSQMTGAVHVLAAPVPAISSKIDAGNFKALAVTSEKRWRNVARQAGLAVK